MKETKIPAGSQLELFWVVYAVPMIAGRLIGIRNNTVARMKKTHYGKMAHMNNVYCMSNIWILFDMSLFSMSSYLFIIEQR